MGAKTYVKRVIRYIMKGIPKINIDLQIVQKTPSDMFKEKKILITGGSKGLGFYIAKKCIDEGAEVIITGRKEDALKEAVKKLGDKAKYIVFDICNVEKIDETFKKIIKENGHIDCLINNAGVSLHEKTIANVTIEGFDLQLDTNLKGAYFLAKSYIKYIEDNNIKNGNIIFVSSERGAQCDQIPYGLTKVAINSLTEGLSRMYYDKGIRVNAIAPGVTATDMTGIDKNENLYCEHNASKRYFIPEEVAEVTAFLISDYSKCVSGEIIYTDGGDHLNPWWK